MLLMGGIACVFAIILFGIGMARGNTFTTSLSLGIGIFVAFALCGMPATVSSQRALMLLLGRSSPLCVCSTFDTDQ